MPSLPTAAQVLAFFVTLLGIGEDPPGSNRNIITRWFGYVAAWCAMTVSYVFAHFQALALIGGKEDYTVTMARWFYDLKQWIEPGGKCLPGDVVFFHFGDPDYVDGNGVRRWKGIHHVGMLEAVLPDGRCVTLEGNTDDAVRRRIRSRSNIAGFGRPKYAAPSYKTMGDLYKAEGVSSEMAWGRLRPAVRTLIGSYKRFMATDGYGSSPWQRLTRTRYGAVYVPYPTR